MRRRVLLVLALWASTARAETRDAAAAMAQAADHVALFAYGDAARSYASIARDATYPGAARRDAATNAAKLFGLLDDRDELRAMIALALQLKPTARAPKSSTSSPSSISRAGVRAATTRGCAPPPSCRTPRTSARIGETLMRRRTLSRLRTA